MSGIFKVYHLCHHCIGLVSYVYTTEFDVNVFGNSLGIVPQISLTAPCAPGAAISLPQLLFLEPPPPP
jgi:hypothetical protein